MGLFGTTQAHDLSKYEGSACVRPAADWSRPLGKSPVLPPQVSPRPAHFPSLPQGPPPPVPPRPTTHHLDRSSAPSILSNSAPYRTPDVPQDPRSATTSSDARFRALPPPPILPHAVHSHSAGGLAKASNTSSAPAWLPQYTPYAPNQANYPVLPPPPLPPPAQNQELWPHTAPRAVQSETQSTWNESGWSGGYGPRSAPLMRPSVAQSHLQNADFTTAQMSASSPVAIKAAPGSLAAINGEGLDEDEALRLALAQSLNLQQQSRSGEGSWQEWKGNEGGTHPPGFSNTHLSVPPPLSDRVSSTPARLTTSTPKVTDASLPSPTPQSPAYPQSPYAPPSPVHFQRNSLPSPSFETLAEGNVSMPRPHPAVHRSSTLSNRSFQSDVQSESQRSVRPPSIGGRTLSSISSTEGPSPEDSPDPDDGAGTTDARDGDEQEDADTFLDIAAGATYVGMSESHFVGGISCLTADASTACCYDKPGAPLSPDTVLTAVPTVISLPPKPSTFQMAATSFQDILREIVAQRDSGIEPSPTAFDAFRSSPCPQFQLVVTFRFVELRSAAPSRKLNKHFETRRGREKLSRYLPGGAFRTILVLELDEWHNTQPTSAPSSELQRSASLAQRDRVASSTTALADTSSCSLLRNPLLPSDRVTETLVLHFTRPITIPCTNEYLVERLHAHLKLGKQARASSRAPDPGTEEENAATFSKLVDLYPGPIGKDAALSRAHKLDKAEDFVSGRSVERRRRHPIRRMTSKVIGAVQHSRQETVEDERESWITPFKMDGNGPSA